MDLQDDDYEIGETLDHFISMFKLNFNEINEENINECIEMSLKLEDTDYLIDLKEDLKSKKIEKIFLENNINNKTIEIFLKTINTFSIDE